MTNWARCCYIEAASNEPWCSKKHIEPREVKNTQSAFFGVEIKNPKLYADSVCPQESRIYPYYAGYASSFAESVLGTMDVPRNSIVLDPWNGSGTTTLAATRLNYNSLGQDLNPVMVLVAKANLLPASERGSLMPLADAIISLSKRLICDLCEGDPLAVWLAPASANLIRAIETAINRLLVSAENYMRLTENKLLYKTSCLASFFYVVLFRIVRHLLKDFIPTNPTWIKKPKTLQDRKNPTAKTIEALFLFEVEQLSTRLLPKASTGAQTATAEIFLGNAENIELPDDSVDIVMTSPPYCTRIDYAISTSVELAVLGVSALDFDVIRRSLMGTTTVPKSASLPDKRWGESCLAFLENVYQHPSKASKTYYYKSHLQYFSSLYNSVKEIARVLKPGAKAVFVVQDSYYKEIRNDVASAMNDMARGVGLSLKLQKDFPSEKTMSGINMRSKRYRQSNKINESVLCFVRT